MQFAHWAFDHAALWQSEKNSVIGAAHGMCTSRNLWKASSRWHRIAILLNKNNMSYIYIYIHILMLGYRVVTLELGGSHCSFFGCAAPKHQGAIFTMISLYHPKIFAINGLFEQQQELGGLSCLSNYWNTYIYIYMYVYIYILYIYK